MIKTLARQFTYESIIDLAETQERTKFEMKNSTYVVLEHPLQDTNVKTTGKKGLKEKLRKMLSVECSSFANSTGGVLVVGLKDADGKPDETIVPEKWHESDTKIDKFIEDVLKSCIYPALDTPEVYTVEPQNGGGARLLVVEVAQSHRPHQALDKLYYTRRMKSNEALFDWEIEDIRSRRSHPIFKANIDLDSSKVVGLRRELSGQREIFVADLRLVLEVANLGSVIAKDWALLIECAHSRSTEVFPADHFKTIDLPLEQSSTKRLVAANYPLYPTQTSRVLVSVSVPVHYDFREGQLKHFQWSGLTDLPSETWGEGTDWGSRWFGFNMTFFLEGSPRIENFQIRESAFWQSFSDWVVANPGMPRLRQ